jgi:hypothetical protein
MMIHNKPLWPHCRKYGWRSWCLREEFLDNFCSLFPIQLMKTTRASLAVVENLLQDSKYVNLLTTLKDFLAKKLHLCFRLKELKVVLLIRDPRAVMYSRSGLQWCKESLNCRDEKLLCKDLKSDFEKYNELKEDYPDRLR